MESTAKKDNVIPSDDKNKEFIERAKRMRVDFVDLSTIELDPEVASLIPEAMARRYTAVVHR